MGEDDLALLGTIAALYIGYRAWNELSYEEQELLITALAAREATDE